MKSIDTTFYSKAFAISVFNTLFMSVLSLVIGSIGLGEGNINYSNVSLITFACFFIISETTLVIFYIINYQKHKKIKRDNEQNKQYQDTEQNKNDLNEVQGLDMTDLDITEIEGPDTIDLDDTYESELKAIQDK